MKRKIYRSKKKLNKVVGNRNQIQKFKDKNLSDKMDHILKKYGLVALPLIYRAILESQYSWDEWSAWKLNEPDNMQEIKDTLYRQAQENEFI